MKRLIFTLALLYSFSAQAVDITITLTAGEIARLQAAVGIERSLGRVATTTEARAYAIEIIKRFVINSERDVAVKAAMAAEPPAFDPK